MDEVYAFRITRRGRPRTGPQPHLSMIPAIPTAAECHACPWAQPIDAHRRCNHPAKGCPSCQTRIDPWTHPSPCPLKLLRRPDAAPMQPASTPPANDNAPRG